MLAENPANIKKKSHKHSILAEESANIKIAQTQYIS